MSFVNKKNYNKIAYNIYESKKWRQSLVKNELNAFHLNAKVALRFLQPRDSKPLEHNSMASKICIILRVTPQRLIANLMVSEISKQSRKSITLCSKSLVIQLP